MTDKTPQSVRRLDEPISTSSSQSRSERLQRARTETLRRAVGAFSHLAEELVAQAELTATSDKKQAAKTKQSMAPSQSMSPAPHPAG